VIHDVAIQKVPLALFLDRAGLVGADGPTHHGVFDMSFLRCVPGMYIMAPKDENELQHMIFTAMTCDKLVSVRFPRGEGLGVALDSQLKSLPLGKSEKLVHHIQPEVCIWAAGSTVQAAVAAAKDLRASGIGCEVVNARFIKPLDTEALLKDAAKVSLIVTVEENAIVGGFGSAVDECFAKNNISTPILNLGIPDEFIEHGNQNRLREYCHIDQKSIVTDTKRRLEQIKLKFVPKKAPGTLEVPGTVAINPAPVHH
jgi:1-deoxy-D-xylulose-5-phosphate synthase